MTDNLSPEKQPISGTELQMRSLIVPGVKKDLDRKPDPEGLGELEFTDGN